MNILLFIESHIFTGFCLHQKKFYDIVTTGIVLLHPVEILKFLHFFFELVLCHMNV